MRNYYGRLRKLDDKAIIIIKTKKKMALMRKFNETGDLRDFCIAISYDNELKLHPDTFSKAPEENTIHIAEGG